MKGAQGEDVVRTATSLQDVEKKESVQKHGGNSKDNTKSLPLLGRLPARWLAFLQLPTLVWKAAVGLPRLALLLQRPCLGIKAEGMMLFQTGQHMSMTLGSVGCQLFCWLHCVC